MRLIAILAALVCMLTSPAIADEVRVIDGDTIVIGTTHYRLLGIAAPDEPKDAKDRSTAVMVQLIRAGGVHCEPTGRVTTPSCICRGVLHSASNIRGTPTRNDAHFAREVATLSRFRL